MFDTHQKMIGKYAQESASNLFQVTQFVLLTIQQQLHTVPAMMKDVNKRGADSVYLWGIKGPAWQWHKENQQEVYDTLMMLDHIHPDPAEAEKQVLLYLAGLKGLGPVKAGFLAQCSLGLAGCLDSHNAKRFNLAPSQLRASSYKAAKTNETKSRIIDAYLSLCKELGGCKGLWDTWCEYVYQRNPSHEAGYYDSAEHVSRIHCEALGLV